MCNINQNYIKSLFNHNIFSNQGLDQINASVPLNDDFVNECNEQSNLNVKTYKTTIAKRSKSMLDCKYV